MQSSIGIFKGDRTHSPSLVGGALDHVREDTAVGEDLRECCRGEGDECGKCEHLWSFGSGRRVVPVKMSARESADRLGHPVGFICPPFAVQYLFLLAHADLSANPSACARRGTP